MAFDYEINAAFPAPKANNLDKIIAVVDVVDAGCNTGESIAEVMDIETREGSYYGDAAGYLGLVDIIPGEPMKTYGVTARGYDLLKLVPLARADFIKSAIAVSPLVELYAEGGNAAVMDSLATDYGYAEETSVRRAATIQSWHNQVAGSTLGAAVAFTVGFVSGRTAAAAATAAEVRKAKLDAMAPVQKSFGKCNSCFMELPASGVCDC